MKSNLRTEGSLEGSLRKKGMVLLPSLNRSPWSLRWTHPALKRWSDPPCRWRRTPQTLDTHKKTQLKWKKLHFQITDRCLKLFVWLYHRTRGPLLSSFALREGQEEERVQGQPFPFPGWEEVWGATWWRQTVFILSLQTQFKKLDRMESVLIMDKFNFSIL